MKLDFGVVYQGFYGDSARTVPVGKVSEEARRRWWTPPASRWQGHPGDGAGQPHRGHRARGPAHVEAWASRVVRDFVGTASAGSCTRHPRCPTTASRAPDAPAAGMVLAVEPMVNAGTAEVEVLEDDWTAVTLDGKPSAHFEHTILVTDRRPGGAHPVPGRKLNVGGAGNTRFRAVGMAARFPCARRLASLRRSAIPPRFQEVRSQDGLLIAEG